MCIQQNIEQIEQDLITELGANTLVIHTHISLLLITPTFSYKIKKAKDLGFLNFKSIESRKFFCEEEIRLNKKTAPSIYLKTVPVYLIANKITFNSQSSSTPIEYAVKMNTFEQNQVLTHCWNEISNKQLLELSKILADFHKTKAETSAEITAFGTFNRLKEIAQNNLLSVKKFVGKTISKDDFQNLETKTLEQFSSKKLHRIFNKRRAQSKIRACHGDLHLNNLCLINNKITPFDCIEFNQEFRYIDTLYDLSFLLMDISFRKHEIQSTLLLSGYLGQNNDYFSLPLIPLYLAMRATVRGKVISMETSDTSISKNQRKAAKEAASKYLDFAFQALNPKQGKVIIISGLSGSGKTFLSKKIQEHIPAIHLRSDVIRKLEFGSQNNLYNTETSEKTYDLLLEHSLNATKIGVNTIIDATFLNPKQQLHFQKQLNPIWIYCQQDIRTLKDRISKRKNDFSDATISVLEKQINQFDEKAFLNTIKPHIYVKQEDFETILTLISSE
jgi:aminoglycoside phosphotransferase family enzyme/predicted kinase